MTLVITNARVMTCATPDLGIVEHGAVACDDGKITWVGPSADAPDGEVIDVGGRLVTPGLVDCHTHLVFAGNRANEFAMRARGATYQEIAAAGGGIASTLGATRGADFDELVRVTARRARAALAAGVTTIEAKSGYDLTVDGELALLSVLQAVGSAGASPRIVPTLLAHVIPPEAKANRAAYVAAFCDELIPRVAARQLATSVDVYCDDGAFTLDETRAILGAARSAGLDVRAHVGQFADLGGAELLAELGARSADHLEQISDDGIAALAAAGVVAVMLPAACIQLRMTPPPIDRLRKAGVALAVASDLNPGTSYCESLSVPMWLATTHYGMTVEETWLGVTKIAARALGRGDLGVLTTGATADLVVWDTDQPADIPYRFATNLARHVVIRGSETGDRKPETGNRKYPAL